MSDPIFVNGLIVKAPNDKAPDFVKAAISIRVEELITFLSEQKTEWVNIDVKESKKGKWYAQVNTFKPESKQDEAIRQSATPQAPEGANDFDDDIPFFLCEYKSVV